MNTQKLYLLSFCIRNYWYRKIWRKLKILQIVLIFANFVTRKKNPDIRYFFNQLKPDKNSLNNMYIIFWMKKKICCFFSLSICTNNINDLFNIIHVRVFYKYNYTLRWFIVFCWNYHGSENQSYVFIFRCRFSRVYDKSGVTDNITKAVSMLRKSYCDKYLKLYFEQVLSVKS